MSDSAYSGSGTFGARSSATASLIGRFRFVRLEEGTSRDIDRSPIVCRIRGTIGPHNRAKKQEAAGLRQRLDSGP